MHYARSRGNEVVRSRGGRREWAHRRTGHAAGTRGARRIALRAIARRRRTHAFGFVERRSLAAHPHSLGPNRRRTAARRGRERTGKRGGLMSDFQVLGWPTARLGEALSALAKQAGFESN